MARSPVTAVIQSFNALTEDEKKLCLDFIAPEPEPEQVAKQTRKKRTTKSAKAQSLSSALANRPIVSGICAAILPNGSGVCHGSEDDPLHTDSTYGNYHPFVPPAQSVARRSSRKGAGTNSEVSSEVKAQTATAVGASGD